MELNSKNKNTDPSVPVEFNRDAFKHAIGMIESKKGTEGFNPSGSMLNKQTGKYNFNYDSIKRDPLMKGVSKRKFMNDISLQDKVMDKALDGNLKGYSYGEGKAREIIKSSGTNHDVNEVAAMIHFIGDEGASDYLKNKDTNKKPEATQVKNNGYAKNFKEEFDSFAPSPEELIDAPVEDNQMTPVQNVPQSMPTQNIPPAQETKNLIQPKIQEDNSIEPEFDYSQDRMSGKSQKPFIPSDSNLGPASSLANMLKEGGQIDECKCGCEGKPPCEKPKNSDENFNNASDLYDPVYEKLINAYGVKDYKDLMNNKEIHPYVRKGLDDAFGYSFDDFDEGKRIVPPMNKKLDKLQKTILNTPDAELKKLLKKDYRDAGVFNMGSFLPDEVGIFEALGYANEFNKLKKEGYTFKEGGSLGTSGCGGEGQPPCNDSYFKTIRNSRQGQVRKNKDGSESTHLMADNNKDKAFPTLFRNKDGSWDDFSGDHDAAFKRATKDNEVYSFGNQKDLFKFAREGSWKSNSLEEGGSLENGDASEQVTVFEGGGTHEENSLGGIPQGIGANGKPNLVEEGETKWNDYIFSNAIDTEGSFTSEDGSKSNVFKAGGMLKRADGSYSKRGLWDNIRANKGSGKKPTAQMLKQESEINKKKEGGNLNKLKMLASKKTGKNINDYKLS